MAGVDIFHVTERRCQLRLALYNEFRSDLYYRLNVFPISLPSLRERREDIPELAEHFVEIFSRRMATHIRHIPAQTMAAFSSYSWPGNIRGLQNLVERAAILAQDECFQTHCQRPRWSSASSIRTMSGDPEPFEMNLRDSERALILHALQANGWRIAGPKGAASKLGLNRSTMQFKMKKLAIERTISGCLSDMGSPAKCELT
jgi:formate hydrogenlyase transcriptional activator